MSTSPSSSSVIDRWLQQGLLAGASFSLLLPFAQAHTSAFGWLPLWLTGLPLAAWLGWRVLNRLATMPTAVGARRPRRIAAAGGRGRRAARPMAQRRAHTRA